jgi:hypothetical protein
MEKTTTRVSVSAAWDAEAGLWYVNSSSLSGLRLEGASLQELYDQLPAAIADLLEGQDSEEVSIDFIVASRANDGPGLADVPVGSMLEEAGSP